ncbi:IGR protein motif-domain-containing protein [Cercophora newfieldiana]|uniref:Small ribosomal subunit protein mS41 n=1 Tax=Cercophora newfieldiana TaxID=92897 RepID=A0AA39YIQ6_9PEZI|nr:IGR protein motif-domain-containing protein [Cercophora newfieldiana]
MKSLGLSSAFGLLLRPCAAKPIVTKPIVASSLVLPARWAHSDASATPPQSKDLPSVPPTTPFVPDVETFLTLIGRNLKQHASKFPTWESLFTLKSEQLKELGVEPARPRRYLMYWRQRFRAGKFGAGGDLLYVENGEAHLRILKTEKDPLTTFRHAVNVPFGKKLEDVPREQLARPLGYKVEANTKIVGPYVLPMRGGGARIKVTEGMWELRRGHKVDGGERRQAEVRFKRRVAERKALREKQH